MKEITLSFLTHLKSKGTIVDKTKKDCRDQVQTLIKSTDTTATELETIQYVFKLLDDSVQSSQETKVFGEKAGSRLLTSSSTATEFAQKFDVNFLEASQIDLKHIHITSTSTLKAANALVTMLSQLLILIPEHKGVIEKKAALEAKVDAYKKEHANKPEPSSFKTFTALNQYIETELKNIAAETDRSIIIKQYQTLKTLAEAAMPEILEPLLTTLIQKKQAGTHNLGEETAVLINTISEKITVEIDFIIAQFDASTHAFTQKIDELEKRSESIHSKHKKNTYIPAIKKARALISDLNQAKIEFKKTGDFDVFQATTQTLLETFSGRAEFAKNRPKRWFYTFISTPFEILKAALSNLIGLVYTKTSENNKHQAQFFKPSKTGTTKAFETYEENLKKLDQTQTKPDKP
ncbi:MAG: hypothetical protein K0U37_07240 [Gammaproteobacteria bacterium]|nr:hypothetical protein [Gammaproteobacteria bacterium]